MAEADPFPTADSASSTEAAENTQSNSAAVTAEPAPQRKKWRTPLMLVVPIILAVGALLWWFGSGDIVKTDNAYVKQDIVSVGSEISGLVVSVQVKENQFVKAGQVLFTIDPSP